LTLVFAAAYVAVLALAGLGIYLGARAALPVVLLAAVAFAVVAVVLLSTLQATMQGVYSAALYRYATNDGRAVPGFPPELMQVAFKSKV